MQTMMKRKKKIGIFIWQRAIIRNIPVIANMLIDKY
jgi:hypothetical protein